MSAVVTEGIPHQLTQERAFETVVGPTRGFDAAEFGGIAICGFGDGLAGGLLEVVRPGASINTTSFLGRTVTETTVQRESVDRWPTPKAADRWPTPKAEIPTSAWTRSQFAPAA